jgi:phosphate-selective porin
MFKKQSVTVPLLLALICALVEATCAGAATQTGSPTVATQPTQTSLPTHGPLQDSPPSVSVPITLTGQVMLIYANSGFLLSDGKTSYTVDMAPTTSTINLRGREVPRQFIQVAGSVTVTGRLSGSTITADVVAIPTVKDGP